LESVNNADLIRKIRLFEKKLHQGCARRHPGMEGDQCRMGHEAGRVMHGRIGQMPDGKGNIMGFQKPAPGGPRMRPPLTREHLLTVISRKPEGIHQKEVAEKAYINQSSVSELINKLESDGYIERRTDPDDKRATLLFLTEKGRARAAEVEDERSEMYRDIFAPLTEDEKQALSDILDKLLTNR